MRCTAMPPIECPTTTELREPEMVGECQRIGGDLVHRERAVHVAHAAIPAIVHERVREIAARQRGFDRRERVRIAEPAMQHQHVMGPVPTT